MQVTKIRARVLGLSLAAGLWAQAQQGSIGGRVSDASGAVIPAVVVRVANSDTGQAVSVATDVEGRYLVPQLLPGFYDLAVEHSGFKRLDVSRIKVDTNQSVTWDAVLELGAVTEKVSVDAQRALVDTVSGSVGHLMDNKEILELPLNGRNVFDLVNLTPTSFRVGGQVSIGGGRMGGASPMLDGIFNSRGGLAPQNIEMNPPIDIMQEFRVEANNYSAQYGRSNGGIVNATTKSGTNSFRGVLFEFVRNDKLDSRAWAADQKSPLRRNQYGGSLGGPMIRNRTFFFYNYDAFRERRGVTRTRTVALPAWRQGDFSALLRQVGTAGQPLPIYDPAGGSLQVFPGNRIPVSRLDSGAVKTLALVPLPNRPPDNPITQGGNWQQNSVNPTDRVHHTIRIDHSLNDHTRIFGRYLLTTPDLGDTGGTRGFGDLDPDGINLRNRRQNLALNLARVFSPNFFVNARYGFAKVKVRRTAIGFEKDWPAQLGLRGVAQDAFPRFNMNNGLVPTTDIGTPGTQANGGDVNNWELHSDFDLIRGSHSLKFGGSYNRYIGDGFARKNPSGLFAMATRGTQGRTAAGALIANTGVTVGDFLLGRPDQVAADLSRDFHKRSYYYGVYFQDDWRISKRLTLNLGIRYDAESPYYDGEGVLSNFDPDVPHPLAGRGEIPANTRGVLTFPNRNGKGKYLFSWDRNNFSPRFGFAWRALGTNDTVVRGGFGVLFGNPYDRGVIENARLGFDAVASFRDPVPFTLQQGLPANALLPPAEQDLVPEFGSRGTRWPQSAIEYVDPNHRTPYSFNYNLTIQHQWRQILFETGYLANLGRKITFPAINVNQIPPELLAHTEIAERLRRPFPQFDSDRPQVSLLAPNWGISNYHAFTFKSERRFSNGYGWIVTYAWSKWIDNVSFNGGDGVTFGDDDFIQNQHNRRLERSLSTNHVPHRLVLTPIVELPFGKGRRWLNRGGVADSVLGGWEFSGIGTLQKGSPFGVTVVNGNTILGDLGADRVLRPNLVGPIDLPEARKGQPAVGQRGIQWLNADGFTAPARFTFGNAARTLRLGPGFVQFDLGLIKNFRIGERRRLQFRWEAFNAFNTPVFQTPASNLGAGNFGISGAGNSDREVQFALKLYF